MHSLETKWLLVSLCLMIGVCTGIVSVSALEPPPGTSFQAEPDAAGDLVVLAWNDLGMHCYSAGFDDIGVLPPLNTLWAQVVRVGDPPQIVTTGISVTFSFAGDTQSTSKSSFWDANPYTLSQNAQLLFGLSTPLPADTGLTGTGMSGTLGVEHDHFVAEDIPLTEFSDSAPATPSPYQLATVVVLDAETGQELATTEVVAPVSTEMHCDNCHYDGGPGNEDQSTGAVEQNILSQHDDENGHEYPPGAGDLMANRPVLCANCHASNALGMAGQPGVPSLSRAIHEKHKERVLDSLAGCYNCHPGPQTECLRDVMYSEFDMDCVDCHGGMESVSENPDPWLNEPRCDSAGCHGSAYQQDQALYRQSTGHGGLYCAACHDSPHAIAPSAEANDAIKFVGWQGHDGPLDSCGVCHASSPAAPGPHGLAAPELGFTFEPDHTQWQRPGQQIEYVHPLQNTGHDADTYLLTWTSSQGWAAASVSTSPTTLPPGHQVLVTTTVTVPGSGPVGGLVDTTIVTATSSLDPTHYQRVVDTTHVPVTQVYLPVILRTQSASEG
ncbi:hypothetical protein ACFLT5_01865 [Chloroflexota bacterium]